MLALFDGQTSADSTRHPLQPPIVISRHFAQLAELTSADPTQIQQVEPDVEWMSDSPTSQLGEGSQRSTLVASHEYGIVVVYQTPGHGFSLREVSRAAGVWMKLHQDLSRWIITSMCNEALGNRWPPVRGLGIDQRLCPFGTRRGTRRVQCRGSGPNSPRGPLRYLLHFDDPGQMAQWSVIQYPDQIRPHVRISRALPSEIMPDSAAATVNSAIEPRASGLTWISVLLRRTDPEEAVRFVSKPFAHSCLSLETGSTFRCSAVLD